MKIQDRVAIVTGGASGIGRAVAEKFHHAGARHVVVVDRDAAGADEVAHAIDGTGVALDVASEDALRKLVRDTTRTHGRVDLFFSNAGYVTLGGLEIANEELQSMWEVHVLSHIYAARAVLPQMIERGEGYILSTASAAGLLTQIGSLAYSVTKHAAVAVAEWIAITHGYQGIRSSVLCPQSVATNIRQNSPDRSLDRGAAVASQDGVLTSEETAEHVLEAIEQERFWILPHPEVAEYARRKATDVDRWLNGMMRFQQRLYEGRPQPGDWIVEGDDG